MTDTEQVYALYVQANPVPDPDELPLSQVETELLPFERSKDMDTQERIAVRPSPKIGQRRRGLVFGLAAIAVVVAVGVGAFLIAGEGNSPVAASEAFPEVVFDGSSCRWDGPSRIERGEVQITVINTTTDSFTLSGWLLVEPALSEELGRTPLGTDMATSSTTPAPAGLNTFLIPVLPQSEVAQPLRMEGVGPQIIDCVTSSEGNVDHVWRAQTTVEVVAP